MFNRCLLAAVCCFIVAGVQAKPGIKSIVVFGDSLSANGNSAIWAEGRDDPTLPPNYPFPYYNNRASNGLVWIEIAAGAYGFDVSPSLAGGTNFAFGGAESGAGLSDQDTPNFWAQIRMWQNAVANEEIPGPMPWQLFTVWFGPNDFLRIIETEQRPVTREDIQNSVTNIARGIVGLHELGARMFLVMNMPPLHLTPYGLSQPPEAQAQLELLVNGFNAGLEQALNRIENAYDKVTILRLDIETLYGGLLADPGSYGLVEVWMPALDLTAGTLVPNPNEYLSWDGFHPTTATHAVLAQKAMDIIPIGSWWGHSVARGPAGHGYMGRMGWIADEHWPWVFSYSMKDGEWMWVYEQGGTPDGFFAYIPKGYKWVFINAMSGWYYDYVTASWQPISP
ncbi:MAG: SGNH/GDSL hydrolase family protein [Puniceicoccaceae bacterium]